MIRNDHRPGSDSCCRGAGLRRGSVAWWRRSRANHRLENPPHTTRSKEGPGSRAETGSAALAGIVDTGEGRGGQGDVLDIRGVGSSKGAAHPAPSSDPAPAPSADTATALTRRTNPFRYPARRVNDGSHLTKNQRAGHPTGPLVTVMSMCVLQPCRRSQRRPKTEISLELHFTE